MTRRITLSMVALLAALIVIICLTLAWLLGTQRGLHTAWGTATHFVPGLQAELIEGRLTGPLKIRNLHFATETFELFIKAADFDWLQGHLLKRVFSVEQLHVRGVRYTQLKPAPPKEEKPFSLPKRIDLPVAIKLRDIVLDGLEYRLTSDAQAIVITRAALAGSFIDSDLRIDTLTAEGPLFELNANGEIKARGDYQSALKVDWQLRPEGYTPALGTLQANGTLADFQIRQMVQPPYNIALDATLRYVQEALKFDAKLSATDIKLHAIGAELPAITFNLNAKARGKPTDLDYDVKLGADVANGGVVNLTSKGGFSEQLVDIQKFLVSVADTPAQLQAGGTVDVAGAEPTLNITVNWQRLRWPLQGGEALAVSPTGKFNVNGTPTKLNATLNAALHGEGRINGGVKRTGETIDVALHWQKLYWPIDQPHYGSPTGKFTLAGTLQDYRLQTDAKLTLPQNTAGQINIAGSGSLEQLNLPTIRLNVLNGQINGHADVVWKPALQADVNLKGRNLDPGIVAPQWPGKVQFQLVGTADRQHDKLFAELQDLAVSGKLRDQPLAVQVQANLQDSVVNLKRFDLQSGPSVINAGGKVGEELALDWRIDSPNLATLLPQAHGTLKGNGKVGGTKSMPAVQADLQGKGIRYAAYSVAKLNLNADVDLSRPAPSELDLTINEAAADGVTIDSLTLTGDGTRRNHSLVLKATSSVGDTNARLSGDLQDDRWAIKLTDASLQYGELGAWQLQGAHDASITTTTQTLQNGCWSSGDAKLCIQGARDAEDLTAAVKIDGLPFAYFQSMLPTNIDLQGALSGTADVSQHRGRQLAVDMKLKTTAGELRTSDTEALQGEVLLAMQPATIDANLGDEGLRANLDLPFVNQGGIQAEASVPASSGPLMQRPLQGKFDIAVQDLGFIASLTPEIEKIGGAVNGAITLAGTLAKPEPNGTIELSNGLAKLSAPGLNITNLALQANSNSSGKVDFSGTATSGKGTLKLLGDAELGGEAPTSHVTIMGENFQAFNTSEARVWVSPDLKIAVDAERIDIDGSVTVPRAAITPKKLPASAISASSDQVVVGKNKSGSAEASMERELHANVQLILGDNVAVDGFGFKGSLIGELEVTQEPDEPTTGSGKLDILDGEYRAYGQGLVIEKGKILFAGGPINQPGINVRAVRRPAKDILVGVLASGSLQQPDFTVFSEPTMTQSEQLSWLVLGRSMAGSSGVETDMITQAAMALSVKGGNYLAHKLGGDLGLDNIGIETGSGEAGAASDVEQAEFVIGKYLSPKLYVSYGIGLFESLSTLKLDYTISDHWKLSSETSTEASGGDVSYSIKR